MKARDKFKGSKDWERSHVNSANSILIHGPEIDIWHFGDQEKKQMAEADAQLLINALTLLDSLDSLVTNFKDFNRSAQGKGRKESIKKAEEVISKILNNEQTKLTKHS